MTVEVQPVEPYIAGVDGAEAAHFERLVEADALVADAGAERIVRGFHRIVVSALRVGAQRSPHEENRQSSHANRQVLWLSMFDALTGQDV